MLSNLTIGMNMYLVKLTGLFDQYVNAETEAARELKKQALDKWVNDAARYCKHNIPYGFDYYLESIFVSLLSVEVCISKNPKRYFFSNVTQKLIQIYRDIPPDSTSQSDKAIADVFSELVADYKDKVEVSTYSGVWERKGWRFAYSADVRQTVFANIIAEANRHIAYSIELKESVDSVLAQIKSTEKVGASSLGDGLNSVLSDCTVGATLERRGSVAQSAESTARRYLLTLVAKVIKFVQDNKAALAHFLRERVKAVITENSPSLPHKPRASIILRKREPKRLLDESSEDTEGLMQSIANSIRDLCKQKVTDKMLFLHRVLLAYMEPVSNPKEKSESLCRDKKERLYFKFIYAILMGVIEAPIQAVQALDAPEPGIKRESLEKTVASYCNNEDDKLPPAQLYIHFQSLGLDKKRNEEVGGKIKQLEARLNEINLRAKGRNAFVRCAQAVFGLIVHLIKVSIKGIAVFFGRTGPLPVYKPFNVDERSELVKGVIEKLNTANDNGDTVDFTEARQKLLDTQGPFGHCRFFNRAKTRGVVEVAAAFAEIGCAA